MATPRHAGRALLAALLAAALLLLVPRQEAFVVASKTLAPTLTEARRQAPRAAQRRVEELSQLSMEACLRAGEALSVEAVEHCQDLCYQLQHAEAALHREQVRQGAAPLAALDNDSY